MLRSLLIMLIASATACNVFFDPDSVEPPTDTTTTNGGTTNVMPPQLCGDMECTSTHPVCDEVNEVCVGCLTNNDCGPRWCEPEAQTCVDCLQDSHCNGNRSCTPEGTCQK